MDGTVLPLPDGELEPPAGLARLAAAEGPKVLSPRRRGCILPPH